MHVIGSDTTYQRDKDLLNWEAIILFLSITKGVPQGSILGPVLFTIYINNIVSSLTNCHAHLYADDTVLYYIALHLAAENLRCSFNILQGALKDLY